MLVQWPTLITALTWPLLILVYYRLARREETEVEAQFGDAYRRYKTEVPMFIPSRTDPVVLEFAHVECGHA
jgi:methanethiol S-methyltransferase